VICGTDMLGPLARAYLNVACDLTVILCDCGLPTTIGEPPPQKEFPHLKLDVEPGGDFLGAVTALLDFYRVKFTVLTDILAESMVGWGDSDPEDALRRFAFWQGGLAYNSIQEAQDAIRRTSSPIGFKETTQVLEDVERVLSLLTTYVKTDGPKLLPEGEVVLRLARADAALRKYENVVRTRKDAHVEIRGDQGLPPDSERCQGTA